MDGKQSAIAPSLQVKLSSWLSLAIIGIAAAAASISFFAAVDEAHQFQDRQLRQTGLLVSRLNALSPASINSARMDEINFEERVVLRFLADRQGRKPAPSPRAPVFSDLLSDGIQTVSVGAERWRVFVVTTDSGMRLAVAQQTSIRDALARARAVRTLLPYLLLVVVLLSLVAFLVRKMFKPLKTLAAGLGRRTEHDLGRLDDVELPSEVKPFVLEINSLLLRVGRSMALQRRFVADAAHELRSPLTAMSLQAEWLAATALPPEAATRLAALRDGLARTRILLDQMLVMARTQELGVETKEATSLQMVIREVLEDLIPLAEDKRIDIGVVGQDDALVHAHHVDLTVLVKNLIDNAIRYTPEGGSVDIVVSCKDGPATLCIDDSGPGIAKRDHERVFDPFYRVLGNGQIGSGLGLSIVRTVAASIDASVTLATAPPPHGGLRVQVVFQRVTGCCGPSDRAERRDEDGIAPARGPAHES